MEQNPPPPPKKKREAEEWLACMAFWCKFESYFLQAGADLRGNRWKESISQISAPTLLSTGRPVQTTAEHPQQSWTKHIKKGWGQPLKQGGAICP